MADPITLDTFMALSSKSDPVPVEIVSFAAVLGTERTDAEDSVWNGDDFGSDLEKRAAKPGGTMLVQNEVSRVMSVVGLDGEVKAERVSLTKISVDLAVSEEGVSIA